MRGFPGLSPEPLMRPGRAIPSLVEFAYAVTYSCHFCVTPLTSDLLCVCFRLIGQGRIPGCKVAVIAPQCPSAKRLRAIRKSFLHGFNSTCLINCPRSQNS